MSAADSPVATIIVEVIEAWPRRHVSVRLSLPADATVAQALAAYGTTAEAHAAVAVHGESVALSDRLRDGDRVELLRALVADPKEARRRRAKRARPSGG